MNAIASIPVIAVPIDLELSSCASAEPFALRVLGDSMAPEFPEHCIIIIDPAKSCDNGAFVIAEFDESRWFRRFVEHEGQRYLVPLNPSYPELLLDQAYEILGLVVQRNIRRAIKHYPNGQFSL
jgi:SOS-response transcriptional repressor LexA